MSRGSMDARQAREARKRLQQPAQSGGNRQSDSLLPQPDASLDTARDTPSAERVRRRKGAPEDEGRGG